MNKERYWSPYVAGAGLGLALLASFVVAGQGLGASRAFTVVAGKGMQAVLPQYTATLTYLGKYLDRPMFQDWTLLLICGVMLGGAAGVLVGRGFRVRFDRGSRMPVGTRVLTAFGGGMLLGFASRLARGCTSGVALTGGAELAVAGWIFVVAMFGSGFLFAMIFRRLWS